MRVWSFAAWLRSSTRTGDLPARSRVSALRSGGALAYHLSMATGQGEWVRIFWGRNNVKSIVWRKAWAS